ncbi:MAG: leucyl aminopeptidase [Deltaproteobacteria bacterium]|nr:leucyl aminopeptidase [Deltaproteobacteria bacterium]
MRITLSTDAPKAAAVDLLAIGVRSKKFDKDEVLSSLDKALGGVLTDWFKDEGFNAKPNQTLKVPARGRVKAKWILLVGVGSKSSDVEATRMVAHQAAKASSRQKSAALVLPDVSPATVRAATEALEQGAYRYKQYKTGTRRPKGGLSRAALLVSDAKDKGLRKAIKDGMAVAESVNLARDLVNGPPNDMNPLTLADISKEEAEKLGLKVTIWNKKQIEKAGMNLFLAVNAGSAIEPRFIHIAYTPEKAQQKVCFVGKGLTFDAGGLCLKPPKSMIDMKCDMAGGAATLGLVLAAARLQLPVEVHAIIGSTENMTGAAAYRPGDVFTSLNGKTVEIINTDAEGRLVLADCLAWAVENVKADYLVTHATLTGACMVALGAHRAGLYTDDDDFAQGYSTAAEIADEKFWRMPLDTDLRKTLDSFVADVKHTGSSYGGSITAALFLKEFVGNSNWLHLDIAGPAFNDSPHGRAPKGGTGFGVATAVRFLEYLALDTVGDEDGGDAAAAEA